jgi:phage-related holin
VIKIKKVKRRVHYERNFKKVVILILVIIVAISAIATTTLYIRENFKLKTDILKIEVKKEINIFDNLPSEPLSFPPE